MAVVAVAVCAAEVVDTWANTLLKEAIMPTVLVVDDSAIDRRLAGGLLEKDPKLNVLYAQDGKSALGLMEMQLPDVIVTDLIMPTMNGRELVEAVHKQYPQLPVIIMTGKGSEQIAALALKHGAASYVPKKRLAQDLAETVASVLRVSLERLSHSRLMECVSLSQHVFVLENDLNLISSLSKFLRNSIRAMGMFEEAEDIRIGVAIDEALMNAYYHGNLEVSSKLREHDHRAFYETARRRNDESPYCSRKVHVRVDLSNDGATFVIRDEGPGFDPSQLPDPTDPTNLDRPSGRGVMLMRSFMDDISYNETGNEVTLIKRRAKHAAPHFVSEANS